MGFIDIRVAGAMATRSLTRALEKIIKGNVTLGSLRGRQDYLIAEGLLAPYKTGHMPEARR